VTRAWNVCLTHDPAYAGLYRAVNDFARALDAPVLSFDDGRRDRQGLAATDGARRVACGRGFLTRDCHIMPAAARRKAEALVADADVLIVHSLFRAHAPWAAGWACRHGRRYWAVPHGCLDPWGLTQRALAKRAWLFVHGGRYFGGAERIICATRRELEKARPWISGSTRGVVMHWPVHTPSLENRDRARKRFRDRHAIPEDAPLLLSVGRLHSMKQPLETVLAFCRAAGERSHLAMVGMDGDLSAADVEAATPTAAKPRVHLTGGLAEQDLADAYLAADGFISLSHRENFGYAFAEALAFGLPVIVTAGHDLAHELPRRADGQLTCGWLLPENSTHAAEQAISEWVRATSAIEGRRSQDAFTAPGRDWATEHLSWERFRSTLIQLA
jgi:glycosyltransferase involved in cell wall biosynthesis